jgi:hypothetical protein
VQVGRLQLAPVLNIVDLVLNVVSSMLVVAAIGLAVAWREPRARSLRARPESEAAQDAAEALLNPNTWPGVWRETGGALDRGRGRRRTSDGRAPCAASIA